MAIFKTEDTKGKKEDLASFISMITRDETPFLSSIGSKKATSVYHEWQTDSLAAPVANAKAEGLDFSAADTPTSTTRLGNYSQILIKEINYSIYTIIISFCKNIKRILIKCPIWILNIK